MNTISIVNRSVAYAPSHGSVGSFREQRTAQYRRATHMGGHCISVSQISLTCRVRGPTSPCPSPLRTDRVGFLSIRSSLLQPVNTHPVYMSVTGFMQMHQILCSVCATIPHRDFMMSLQFLSAKQMFATYGTSPVLVFSHIA